MQALFEAVREQCRPGLWSQGVEFVRAGAVSVETRSDDEVVTRVRTPGRAAAPTAILYPNDGEWTCDCGSAIDPCAHVAAAIIALNQASQNGVELTPAREREGHLAYALRSERGYLAVDRHCVAPSGQSVPLTDSLSSPAGRERVGIQPTHDDLQVDRLLLADRNPQYSGKRLVTLLGALAGCADVRLQDRPVKINVERITPLARVFDEKGLVVLELSADPRIDEVVARGVVRLGDTLHPMGEMDLSGDRLERLPSRRELLPSELGELVGRILPELQKRLPVEITSRRLPRGQRRLEPRIAIELFTLPGALEVLPTLVYGDPPVARVDGDRLIQLGNEVPVRLRDRENELVFELRDKLNLVPGRRARFDGVDASRFVRQLDAWNEQQRYHATAPFARESLVPKVHIEGDTFRVEFAVGNHSGAGAPRAEAGGVIQAWQNGLDVVPLDTGGWATLPREWLDRHGHLIADLLAARDRTGQVPPSARLLLAELCEALEQPVPVDLASLRKLVYGSTALPEPELPGDLRAELRPYQRTGVAWLTLLRRAGLGGILADDMGLGKTVQAIAILGPGSLVVCPRSVIHNWRDEIGRFRPGLTTQLHHGSRRTLAAPADVTLTTYGTLRQDIDLLSARKWSTIVLDEAQSIKNAESQAAQCAYRLNADFRLALSGTPIENRLEELWSILHFAARGLLGGRSQFQKLFAAPIAGGDETTAIRLRQRIRPFLLRRLKRDVLSDLPPRTNVTLHIELSEDERAIYETIRRGSREVMQTLQDGEGNVMAALEALLRLRQAACHPGLLPGQDCATSSKLECLLESLEDAASDGHKALVFSQWTSLLDLIEPALRDKGLTYTRLDGQTRDRAEVVKSFQNPEGPPVLLTSLKAGGTGLNLTAADHVFLMDPWWNPAVEDQAADRAHRIGQERPVLVYRLVARETVEEGILALQEHKRGLSDLTFASADHGPGLSREELMVLLA